jgi:regulator of cell morphogenesis and NO signaling
MALRSIEILLAEHREVRSLLSELESLISRLQSGPGAPADSLPALGRITDMLRRGLAVHIKKENDGLFPALRTLMPEEAGPIAVMQSEHEEVNELLRGLLEGVAHLKCCPTPEGYGSSQVRQQGGSLIQALRSHLLEEEQVLFPLAEDFMSAEEDRQVAYVYEQITANFAPAPRAK